MTKALFQSCVGLLLSPFEGKSVIWWSLHAAASLPGPLLQPEGGKPFIEGILSISWGVRHPIRLKVQDEKQLPSFVTLKAAESEGLFPAKR